MRTGAQLAVIDLILQAEYAQRYSSYSNFFPGLEDSIERLPRLSEPSHGYYGAYIKHSSGLSEPGQPYSLSENYVRSYRYSSMGIAAGGKLIQDIYADTNPRHIWNKSRTGLVNVHILNSFTFEQATHIVPPPTPITAKAYKDLGLPVFLVEEEVDGRVDGGNPLKGVQSVSMMDKEMGIDGSSDTTFNPLKPKKCGTCEARLCDCMYVVSTLNIGRDRPRAN